jgi:hypothetical protein
MEELRTSAVKRRFYTHIQGVGNIEDSASNDARVASGSDGPGLVVTVHRRLKAFFREKKIVREHIFFIF